MQSSKSAFISSESIASFFRRHMAVYFLTFSEPGRMPGENLWSKDEAEQHFKPFRDYCARRGIELLVVWERQVRGSWHPHCLVDKYIDVNFMRPWMMARGWGQQMRFEWVGRTKLQWDGRAWSQPQGSSSHCSRVANYLIKYLRKSSAQVESSVKKKCFGGSRRAKAGTTKFSWMPEEKPGAYLYAMGRALFVQLFGHLPTFRDIGTVVRLGVGESDWDKIDFLWEFSVPSG
jgi:hypothetical protein